MGGESHQEIVLCRAIRACGRAVCLPSEIGSQKWPPAFSLFPLWRAELSLFLFWGDELSLFPFPHPPNLLSNFSRASRYITNASSSLSNIDSLKRSPRLLPYILTHSMAGWLAGRQLAGGWEEPPSSIDAAERVGGFAMHE